MGCATRLRISILLSYSHSLRSQDNGMRCFRLKRYLRIDASPAASVVRTLSVCPPAGLCPIRLVIPDANTAISPSNTLNNIA